MISRASHAAIVLLPIPLALLLWRRRRFEREDLLLLLAFVLLLRCLLDPIDNPYYHAPFIFSLAVWEGLRLRGLPALSILVSALVVLSLHEKVVGSLQFLNPGVGAWIPVHVFYLAWALPLALGIGLRLYAPGALRALRRRLAASGRLATLQGRPPIGSHS